MKKFLQLFYFKEKVQNQIFLHRSKAKIQGWCFSMKKLKKRMLCVYQCAFKKWSKAFTYLENKWEQVHKKPSIFMKIKLWIKKGKKKMLHYKKSLRNQFYFK